MTRHNVEEEEHYVLPDGRQLRRLSASTFQWLDMNGRHLGYQTAEVVEYEPSRTGQFRALKAIRTDP